MKYGLDEMLPAIEIEDDINSPNMSRRSSTSSEDSFEIVSAETCESPKNEMSSSFIPSVTFSEIFDIYPMDSDVIARISCDDNFPSSSDDIVVVLPMSWATVEQAVCVSKVVNGYVKFDVNELPKDDRCCYQLCYCATERKTVVGVSIPFSFREVREEELMDFQKQTNKEFYTFRSRFAILMDIHWNTLLRMKNNVPSTEIRKPTNSSLSSFVDMQESIQAANDVGKLINSSSRFIINGAGILDLLVDDNVRERSVENVHHDDRSTDKLKTSLNKTILGASVDIDTTDNSPETQETAVNEHPQNSPPHVYAIYSQVESNIPKHEIKSNGEQKKSFNTSINTDEFNLFSKCKSGNTSGPLENIESSRDGKQPANVEIGKPGLIEIVPDVSEMYCSAKDFQEFENVNNQLVQNDTQRPVEKIETDAADSQIKDFMTEVTRLIETDFLCHQMSEYEVELERYYKEQYMVKEEATRKKEEELARKLVNVTIEKQNLLQSHVDYKVSSENRLRNAAKEYVKLYLRWKKLLVRNEI